MAQQLGFSWIDKPLLAGLAIPESEQDLRWLRRQGIEVLVSLTEEPPRRDWTNDAGLLVFHEPIADMQAPTQEQLDRLVSAVARAHDHKMGVAVHCGAGMGRTGVVLAAYLVHKGLGAKEAINRVRKLRPGSIETEEQADAVKEFATRRKTS